jgi:hypothetical protein
MADYVPNKLRCAKCNFELERLTMNANTGAVGIGTNEPERCPNGCGPLWRVTWEQEAKSYAKAMNEWADRAIAAEKKLAASNVVVTFGPTPPKGPCTVCTKPYSEHGTYPTCATHPYTNDGTCQYVIGARCIGAECVNGCVRGSAGTRVVPVTSPTADPQRNNTEN